MNAKVLRLRSRANDKAPTAAVTPDAPAAVCTDVETAAYLTVHGFSGGAASRDSDRPRCAAGEERHG